MKNITLSKEVLKAINNNSYYSEEHFKSDVSQYIKAIKEGRVIVSVVSVSKSGMSRRMKFLAFQKSNYKDQKKGYYRQFNSMFEVLGWKVKDDCLNVGGCGMNMIFHVNYTVMHYFKRMGFITDNECGILAQETLQTI